MAGGRLLSTVIYSLQSRSYVICSVDNNLQSRSRLIYAYLQQQQQQIIYCIPRAAGMVVGGGHEENANDNGAAAAAGVQPEPRRGVSGLPRGVRPVKGQPGQFQARVSYKPADAARATQRQVGIFTSVDEAGDAVRAAEELLAAGGDPWHGAPKKERQHKRGEVRCMHTHPQLAHTLVLAVFAVFAAGTSACAKACSR